MKTFWHKLKKPFFVLAPMEAVTDMVFREAVALNCKSDVLFTEFTSSDALFSKGFDKTINRFDYSKLQRPIVAQVWGNNVQNLVKSATLIKELKFDGMDINMGCPDENVVKKGSGSGLINNFDKVKEIVFAIKQAHPKLPLSIKTRLGQKDIVTNEWVSFLLTLPIDALTIHLRTAEEKSRVDAHWDQMELIVDLRNKINKNIVIIGNGDVKSVEEGNELHKKYKMEGLMIGRGIFSNFFVFDKLNKTHTKQELLNIMCQHTQMYEKYYNGKKNFDEMKKFFKMYVREFVGANELKNALMETKNYGQVKDIIEDYLKNE